MKYAIEIVCDYTYDQVEASGILTLTPDVDRTFIQMWASGSDSLNPSSSVFINVRRDELLKAAAVIRAMP